MEISQRLGGIEVAMSSSHAKLASQARKSRGGGQFLYPGHSVIVS
jgi:hypothetical protein